MLATSGIARQRTIHRTIRGQTDAYYDYHTFPVLRSLLRLFLTTMRAWPRRWTTQPFSLLQLGFPKQILLAEKSSSRCTPLPRPRIASTLPRLISSLSSNSGLLPSAISYFPGPALLT